MLTDDVTEEELADYSKKYETRLTLTAQDLTAERSCLRERQELETLSSTASGEE